MATPMINAAVAGRTAIFELLARIVTARSWSTVVLCHSLNPVPRSDKRVGLNTSVPERSPIARPA
jgi:hypothetical protein